jgi:hypothetical protein
MQQLKDLMSRDVKVISLDMTIGEMSWPDNWAHSRAPE